MISFSGDHDERHEVLHSRPATAVVGNQHALDENIIINERDEELHIGSTTTFQDFDQRESYEMNCKDEIDSIEGIIFRLFVLNLF